MMKKILTYLLSLLMFSSIAQGAVLVDTGEPTYTGGLGVCRFESTPDRYCDGSVALKINLAEATNITNIQSHISLLGNPTGLTVALYSNASIVPGQELYSGVLEVKDSGWNVLSDLNWTVEAGSYWVAYESREGQHFWGYLWSAVPRPLEVATTSMFVDTWENIGYHYSGGLIVEGTPIAAVPEPESYAMLLAGLGVIGFVNRRRKSTQT